MSPSLHNSLLSAFLDGKSCATMARTFNLSVEEVLAWFESDLTQSTLRRLESLQLQQARIASFSVLPAATGSLSNTSTNAGDLALRTRAAASLVRLGLRFSAPPPKPPPLTMDDFDPRHLLVQPRENTRAGHQISSTSGVSPRNSTSRPAVMSTSAPHPNSTQAQPSPSRQPIPAPTHTPTPNQAQPSPVATRSPDFAPLLSRLDSAVSSLRAASGAPARRDSHTPHQSQNASRPASVVSQAQTQLHANPRPPDSIAVAEAQPSSAIAPNPARNTQPTIPLKSAA